MAKPAIYTASGSKSEKKITLPKEVFEVPVNAALVDQAYRAYLAAGRAVSASTLSRGDVRGGGKKPWRQKGTGRARVGSIRVPNWRGGGVVFGPSGNENYTINLPAKAKHLAVRQALSLKATAGEISIIESLVAADAKTKTISALLVKLGVSGNVVLVVDSKSAELTRATNNLAGVSLVQATYLNVFTIMNADHLILTADAITVINGWLGTAAAPKKPVAKAEVTA